MVLTGLAMSPAVTAAFPLLLRLFGGYQSARTIHFFAFVALVLFVLVHVVMVVMSGFRRQMRAMTRGGVTMKTDRADHAPPGDRRRARLRRRARRSRAAREICRRPTATCCAWATRSPMRRTARCCRASRW